MAGGLILEGVTGAGKTRTLQALLRHPRFLSLLKQGCVFGEDETLSELMAELRNPALTNLRRCSRLHCVLEKIEKKRSEFGDQFGYLMERFHPSFYALMPNWNLYEEIDSRLFALNCRVVMLYVPEDQLERRTLYRLDREGTEWLQEMTEYFGTAAKTLEAIALSQKRRREFLTLSNLPRLEIETTEMSWDIYAERAIQFWAGETN